MSEWVQSCGTQRQRRHAVSLGGGFQALKKLTAALSVSRPPQCFPPPLLPRACAAAAHRQLDGDHPEERSPGAELHMQRVACGVGSRGFPQRNQSAHVAQSAYRPPASVGDLNVPAGAPQALVHPSPSAAAPSGCTAGRFSTVRFSATSMSVCGRHRRAHGIENACLVAFMRPRWAADREQPLPVPGEESSAPSHPSLCTLFHPFPHRAARLHHIAEAQPPGPSATAYSGAIVRLRKERNCKKGNCRKWRDRL